MEVGESISFNFARTSKDKGALDQSLMTQLGANTGQITYASIGDMRTRALGLQYTSVASNEMAQAAITEVDNATVRVSSQRSLLGAVQNRMEYAINALETTSENVTSAESRIRDTDMAAEMSKFSKENIKSQAAQTMVAQANARAQQVLSLLQ
jgi:flagellin